MSETEQTHDTEQSGTPRFYYTVSNQHIFLEAGIKTEIIEKRDVFPIPHTPDWCQGMISLRGKLIPVVDLQSSLNTSDETKVVQSPWLLVLEKAPFPQLAICIDQLPVQQWVNDEPHHTLDHENYPKWLTSSIKIDDQTFYVANHTGFFEQLVHENETGNTT
ncbi:MAG: chemotaxis protein CheW [Leucothrix sp.]